MKLVKRISIELKSLKNTSYESPFSFVENFNFIQSTLTKL